MSLIRTDSLATQIKNEGAKPRWSQLDAYILVHKYVLFYFQVEYRVDMVTRRIDSLKVNDDSEIDWKKLPDEHWNIWSAHTLQRRWLTMKRSVKGYEEMSHAGTCHFSKRVYFVLMSACRTHGHTAHEEGPDTSATDSVACSNAKATSECRDHCRLRSGGRGQSHTRACFMTKETSFLYTYHCTRREWILAGRICCFQRACCDSFWHASPVNNRSRKKQDRANRSYSRVVSARPRTSVPPYRGWQWPPP